MSKIPASKIGNVDIKFSESECCYESSGECIIDELGCIEMVEAFSFVFFDQQPEYGLPVKHQNLKKPLRNDNVYCPILAYRWFVCGEDVRDPEISKYSNSSSLINGRHRYCIAKKLGLLHNLMINIVD
jgi:hypothetical protein